MEVKAEVTPAVSTPFLGSARSIVGVSTSVGAPHYNLDTDKAETVKLPWKKTSTLSMTSDAEKRVGTTVSVFSGSVPDSHGMLHAAACVITVDEKKVADNQGGKANKVCEYNVKWRSPAPVRDGTHYRGRPYGRIAPLDRLQLVVRDIRARASLVRGCEPVVGHLADREQEAGGEGLWSLSAEGVPCAVRHGRGPGWETFGPARAACDSVRSNESLTLWSPGTPAWAASADGEAAPDADAASQAGERGPVQDGVEPFGPDEDDGQAWLVHLEDVP
nr:hypothetical protein [Streptomyces sp. MMG1121]